MREWKLMKFGKVERRYSNTVGGNLWDKADVKEAELDEFGDFE